MSKSTVFADVSYQGLRQLLENPYAHYELPNFREVPAIQKFKFKNAFTSNFYPCEVPFEGLTYQNSEIAFQAQKSLDAEVKKAFADLAPNEAKIAKKLGGTVVLRKDWEEVRVPLMLMILKSKFDNNPDLKQKLLDTAPKYLLEGNMWHDNTWGHCYCNRCSVINSKNLLGRLLMYLREYYFQQAKGI